MPVVRVRATLRGMNSSPEAVLSPDAPTRAPLYDEGALGLDARDVMTPGVISISEEASVQQAVEAMDVYRIHAILVIGSRTGTPLGWVTTRGLLGLLGREASTPVTDAITEQISAIEPTANLRSAIYALALPGVTRLLVRRRGQSAPEGVITDFDLSVKALRFGRPTA